MITPTRTRTKDFKPAPMGNVATNELTYDIASIEANRFFELNATNLLAEHEKKILSLDESEYEKWLSSYKMKSGLEGFKFSSPSGRPQMKMWNNRLFARPMSFSFQVDVRESIFTPKGFQLKGILYQDFFPTWWSDFDLQTAQANNARLTFGMARYGGEFFCFYANLRDRIIERRAFPYKNPGDYCIIEDRNGTKWYIPKRKSTSVLTSYRWLDYKPTLDFTSNLTGDANAVMNYGNFFNTSSMRAHAMMTQIFRKFNSYLPSKLANLKPKSPYFLPKITVEIERGATTVLIGDKSVTKLKLINVARPQLIVKINCEQDTPYKVERNEPVVHEAVDVWSDED